MSSKSKIPKSDLSRPPGRRNSISFSIAYVRVCEWAKDPIENIRPKPDVLDQALEHARRVGDPYIIEKVHEALRVWEEVTETPTPKELHPKTSASAEFEVARLTAKLEALKEKLPNSFYSNNAIVVPKRFTSAAALDRMLEEFLLELEEMERVKG